jgi:sugar phosphate isomerase/epimerase
MKRDQISLQLYTLRERTAKDMLGTLKEVAGMGYGAVEFAGFGGFAGRELRAALDEYGLRAPSAHVPVEDWRKDPRQVFSDLHALDCSHAVVPVVPRELREGASGEAAARFYQELNGIGEACKGEGLRFSYHNHHFEFAPLGGTTTSTTTMWDVFLRETDPALVGMELDLYWAEYAGVDPEGLLQSFANRVSLVHLKDMYPDEERSDAPVGEGTMDWGTLIGAADAAGVEWYVVEQDNLRDPLADVRTSLQNLERFL